MRACFPADQINAHVRSTLKTLFTRKYGKRTVWLIVAVVASTTGSLPGAPSTVAQNGSAYVERPGHGRRHAPDAARGESARALLVDDNGCFSRRASRYGALRAC
jgi:hypothetical protein